MLYIYRRVNINPIVKQLIYILVPLLMAASFSIGMRQFIDENQLRLSRYGAVEIKFVQNHIPMPDLLCGNHLQTVQQLGGLWTRMRFHITGHHVDSPPSCRVSGFQHGISLSYPGRISEKYFQTPPALCLVLIFTPA